ncbi:MAG TPA: hypothetical protein VHO48_13715 [Anaerolineaceae bacterium]|nr:hypothetical protein [Anaerolineaceae bacterium]
MRQAARAVHSRTELIDHRGFDDEIARAGQHGAAHVIGVDLIGQNDHLNERQPPADRLGDFELIHVAQVNVQNNDIRFAVLRDLDGFFPIFPHAHDFKVAFFEQHLA